jgi:hypothetical protein
MGGVRHGPTAPEAAVATWRIYAADLVRLVRGAHWGPKVVRCMLRIMVNRGSGSGLRTISDALRLPAPVDSLGTWQHAMSRIMP